MKKILILLSLVLVFILTPINTLAQEESATPSADLNTFELFWPVTAGKTKADSNYFLKTMKENLRGMIIFSDSKKAEYNNLLAVKRLLEADKLYSEGKGTLAEETMAKCLEKLSLVSTQIDKAGQDKLGSSDQVISDRTTNMQKLLQQLKTKNPESNNISKVIEEVDKINQKLNP